MSPNSKSENESIPTEPITVPPVEKPDETKIFSPEETRLTEPAVKGKRKPYEIKPLRIGRSVNTILKAVERHYPSLTGQLILDEMEIELLDDAFKPFVDSFLKKAKVDASYIDLAFAVVVILVPRILALYDESQKTKPTGNLAPA
jgi:hypothetical protein